MILTINYKENNLFTNFMTRFTLPEIEDDYSSSEDSAGEEDII